MTYTLTVSDQDFAVIWASLGEMPAKHSFATMERLKAQVSGQEAIAPRAAAPVAAMPSAPAAPAAEPALPAST